MDLDVIGTCYMMNPATSRGEEKGLALHLVCPVFTYLGDAVLNSELSLQY